jgi:hypothetical protein
MCGTLDVLYLSQVAYGQVPAITSQTEFNSFINGTLIPAAEKFIDGYCGHSFGTPTPGTLTLDGNGKQVLFLPPKYAPMIGVSAGSVNGVAITPITAVHAFDQHLEYRNGNWTSGCKNVVLYGSYGYASMPKDISYVCAQICANVLLDMVRRRMAPDLFASVMQGGGQVGSLWASPDVFTENLRKTLDPYVIKWIDCA